MPHNLLDCGAVLVVVIVGIVDDAIDDAPMLVRVVGRVGCAESSLGQCLDRRLDLLFRFVLLG
jgi:hypothetical protein